jgi:hypothetical protein
MALVAIIERFRDTSRNCAPRPDRAEESETVTLGGGAIDPLLPLQCIRSLCRIAFDNQLTRQDKRAIIAAALRTRGAPASALGHAAGLLDITRDKHFDAIKCYSARGFALARTLATISGIPLEEFIDHGTRYFGEFAFELLAVIPYAYWLHQNGRLEFTQSSLDTRSLYYFSPAHEELSPARSYVPVSEYPSAHQSRWRFDPHGFPRHLDTSKWVPPPYKAIYRNDRFVWGKPLCIISNKYTSEPSALRLPVNFLTLDTLTRLFDLLTPHYQVIYVRPRDEDIVADHQHARDLGDFRLIESRHPEVITIQRLHADNPDLSYNDLQLRLFANCDRFISVLGGSAFLASYFGGTNIVYARRGWEVACNAYDNWFDQFSGARVIATGSRRTLIELAEREYPPS